MQEKIIFQGGRGEIVEKKSRFIADVYPIQSEEDAVALLEQTRKQHWNARHHCSAYRLRREGLMEHFSDDGEPSGTAGKPILDVLRGEELVDTLIIVTRYFGGTLLGTGGLIRAYTQAAQAGIQNSRAIIKIEGVRLLLTATYTDAGKIQYWLKSENITPLHIDYQEQVTFTILASPTQYAHISKALTEAVNGRLTIEEKGPCTFGLQNGETIELGRTQPPKSPLPAS